MSPNSGIFMSEMQATGKPLLVFRGFDKVLEIEPLLFLLPCPGHAGVICLFQDSGASLAAISVLFTVVWQ